MAAGCKASTAKGGNLGATGVVVLARAANPYSPCSPVRMTHGMEGLAPARRLFVFSTAPLRRRPLLKRDYDIVVSWDAPRRLHSHGDVLIRFAKITRITSAAPSLSIMILHMPLPDCMLRRRWRGVEPAHHF